MDDRYRPRDTARRPSHPGSAPPTPYYRDRYPDQRRAFSPDKRRFDPRDRPREWERERERDRDRERDRYPLENTGFYRSSSAGYTRDSDVAGPSSRRWPVDPPRRDGDRAGVLGERGGLGEMGRVKSWNSDYPRSDDTPRPGHATSPPSIDRFGNRPPIIRKPSTEPQRYPRISSVPSPPHHAIHPRTTSPHAGRRTSSPARHPSPPHPQRSASPGTGTVPPPMTRRNVSETLSPRKEPSPLENPQRRDSDPARGGTRVEGDYRSLLERMEPRSSLSTPERDHAPPAPLVQEVLVQPYEKELGEISPELGRTAVRLVRGDEGYKSSLSVAERGAVEGVTADKASPAAEGDLVKVAGGRLVALDQRRSEEEPTQDDGQNPRPEVVQTSSLEPVEAMQGLHPQIAQDGTLDMVKQQTDPASVVSEDPLRDPTAAPTGQSTTPIDQSASVTDPERPSTLVVTKKTADVPAETVDVETDNQASNRSDSVPVQAVATEPAPLVSAASDTGPVPAPTEARVSPAPLHTVDTENTPTESVPRSPATEMRVVVPVTVMDVPVMETPTVQPDEATPVDVAMKNPPSEVEPRSSEGQATTPVAEMDEPSVPEVTSTVPLEDTSIDVFMQAVPDSADATTKIATDASKPTEAVADGLLDAPEETTTNPDLEVPPTTSNTMEPQSETNSARTAPPAGLERLLLSESTSSDLTSLASNYSMEQQSQSSDRASGRGVPGSIEQDLQHSTASGSFPLRPDVPGAQVLETSTVDVGQVKATVIASDSATHVVPVPVDPVLNVRESVGLDIGVTEPTASPSGTVPSGIVDDIIPSVRAVTDSSTPITSAPGTTEQPDQPSEDEAQDPLPEAIDGQLETSPTAPTTIQLPKVNLSDPVVTQRMLERQVMLGRRNVMSHSKSNRKDLTDKVHQLKREYSKLDKEWEDHKTRIISENEELARQLEAVANPATVQEPKAGGRKTRRGFVEQDHELMGFRDGDEEALAKALKAIEEMMESDPTQRALKTEATIPDMELDPDIWRLAYDDENALVRDPITYYAHGVGEQPGEWTEEEERKFRRLYAAYPKQFGEIAKGLPNKTTAQCVKHYYLTKKKRPFKEGANRNGQRQAAGGQAARMVAPVTREKVELAGVLATGDRAQAKQVADNIRPQGDGKRSGKRKADDADKPGDQGSKDGKAKRKSGKKRVADPATGGDHSATPDGAASKKRKTQGKKPMRLDLKEARAQSTSNRSSSSRGPSTGPPTADVSKGPQPGLFMPDGGALPPRLIGNPPERPHSTPVVTWQDQQSLRDGEPPGNVVERTVRETQTVPPEGVSERRSGGMAIISLLNTVSTDERPGGVKPASVASDATEDEGPPA